MIQVIVQVTVVDSESELGLQRTGDIQLAGDVAAAVRSFKRASAVERTARGLAFSALVDLEDFLRARKIVSQRRKQLRGRL